MADSNYTIDITARAPGLAKTVGELGALESGMRREQSAISTLDAAMKRLGKSGSDNAAVLSRMSAASAAAQDRLAKLSASYAGAVTHGGDLVAKSKETSTGLRAFDNSLKQAQGGGIMAAALEKIAEKYPKIARVIRIVMVLGQALYSAGKSAVNFGISIAKASLKVFELQQADAITYEGLLHSEAAGRALGARITSLADTYGIATKDAGAWAAQLVKAGVRGTELSTTLKGLAIRQAATGDASEALGPLIEQYKAGERTAAGFAAEQERMFGPAALKRGKTFEAWIDRIKRRFGEMLASPAMASGLEAVFGKVESFLKSPAAAEFASSITNTVGSALKMLPGLIDSASTALGGLASAFSTIAGIIGPIVKGIGDFAAGLGKLASGNVSTAEAASAAAGASESLGGKKMQFLADHMRESGEDAGGALAEGTASGIATGTAQVTAAAAAMSAAASAAVKSALEIHSPSRVFARLGVQTAQGFAAGMNDNAAPQAAATAMVRAPSAAPARSTSRVAQQITVNIYGVKDADHARALIEAELAEVLEAAVLAGGGAAA